MRHPEVTSAKANRDFVMKQMSEAVNAISGATQATGASGPHPLETPGALASALDDFDVSENSSAMQQCKLDKLDYVLFASVGKCLYAHVLQVFKTITC